MQAAVEADLRQLKLAMSIYERYDRAVSTSDIHDEIADRLREELDYRREAAHLKLYRAMLAAETRIHVPELVETLSTRRLLTMTWLDGSKILDVVDRPLEFRNEVAATMFRAWYWPLYGYGVIHGDPHLGNYTARDDGTVNLMDFGCIRVFEPGFVKGVIDLYNALRHDDRDLAVHAYEGWGFRNLTAEVIEVLNRWARFVYAPLMEDRVKKITDTGLYGREVAEGVHRDLKSLGGVRPPREFVFMDRAAIGLGSVFVHLKAELNWHRLFHELIDGFDTATTRARQRAALEAAGVPASP
jgi:predicted unusual protein kinase regulating ubiquinone biosynthesis (AarF/ABC1/UbiB family)